ncbi:asparaginase [Bosea vaviloviae]|uniref:L-asparaginase n=1 Tax=Bosea vaviloviae TaxID=1526658 RepID=A0A1D7U2F1_9HYPH|nr:asparaginase [Bosea vaviloviae]AOO81550.1 L-asparaginase [Bosea vaviloviae]
MSKGRVAVIGTGGTIGAVGRDVFDLHDYDANGVILDAAQLLEALPRREDDPVCYAVPFSAVPSTRIGFAEWRGLAQLCARLVADDPELTGIVITHGTSTLEETAYFLNLTLTVAIPVVLVGSMRPSNGLSSDGALNLRNGIRVAACPEAVGLGVLVVLNDEIHSARDVTKCSNSRVQAFQSPVHGLLGQVDSDRIAFYRRPLRAHAPDTEFEIEPMEALPRVDILYAYVGGDDVLARAAIGAGARGIVSAGFAPGATTQAEKAALREAAANGIIIVQSSRAGAGRVPETSGLATSGFLSADDLTPQKARILLALALTRSDDVNAIEGMFRRY